MPRTRNFYYQSDPMPEIANGMVRAIFGDPEMAAKQQQMRAEMDLRAAQRQEATAHGNLYASQTAGEDGRNRAAASLPDLIANLAPPRLPPPPSLDDPNFVTDAGPSAPRPTADEAFRAGLPAVVAAMAQMDPNGPDPRQSIGTLASFLGGDEMARRGLVAQGNTPGENFALTPQRADQISARDAGEKQSEAFGVARINHASDIPVANIQASANRYGADRRLEGTEYSADARSGGSGATRGMRNNNPGNLEYGPFARSLGATGSDGRFAIFPTFEAGVKAQEKLLGGPTYYGGGLNTINAILNRYAPPGENPTGNYAAFVSRVTGLPADQPLNPGDIPTVAAAMRQFESGGGTGAINKNAPKGKAAAAPKPPKPVSKANLDQIDKEIKDHFANYGITLAPLARQQIREQAIAEFQKTGNVVGAVQKTVRDRAVARNPGRWGGKPATPASNAPPMAGARRAPDGNWYVQTGTKPDGSPAYSRVEG